jgi:hypothetical protein
MNNFMMNYKYLKAIGMYAGPYTYFATLDKARVCTAGIISDPK